MLWFPSGDKKYHFSLLVYTRPNILDAGDTNVLLPLASDDYEKSPSLRLGHVDAWGWKSKVGQKARLLLEFQIETFLNA